MRQADERFNLLELAPSRAELELHDFHEERLTTAGIHSPVICSVRKDSQERESKREIYGWKHFAP